MVRVVSSGLWGLYAGMMRAIEIKGKMKDVLKWKSEGCEAKMQRGVGG